MSWILFGRFRSTSFFCPCLLGSLLCGVLVFAGVGDACAQTPLRTAEPEGVNAVFVFPRTALYAGPASVSLTRTGDDGEPGYGPSSGPWVPSLRSVGGHALDVATAPARLSTREQIQVLGAGGLVAGLIAYADRPANRYVRRGQPNLAASATGPLAAPGRLYDRIGPDRVALGAAGVLAVGGVALQNRRWTRTSVRLAEALVYTKLVVGFGKGLFSRSRPFAASSPTQADVGAFTSTHSKLAMPSGHTARAFALASVLAHEFDRWYVRIPAYATATSVALERVRSSDHWLSDVVVGGTLGYLIGRSVTTAPSTSGRVHYTPVLSPDRLGVVVRF